MDHCLWSDVKSFLNEDNSSITYRINNLQHKVSDVFLLQCMLSCIESPLVLVLWSEWLH